MGDGGGAFDTLEAFAARRAAVVAMVVWAAAEAIALPVVPDVGLCLLALAAPRQGLRLFPVVVAGAVAGTVMLALLAAQAPDGARAMLLSLPGIDGAVIAEGGRQLAGDGVLGFVQIGPGPPLKVYTSEWLALGGDVPGLILGSILNRLSRIGPVLLAAAGAGWWLGSWIRQHDRLTLAGYAAFWLVVYALLWS